MNDEAPPEESSTGERLREVAPLFLKLGFIAFGGPAAHIAMMRGEVVDRRQWMTEAEFLDLLGASNLIPGPTSTEMAIYLGYVRAGPWGLVAAGTLFILPAMLIVLLFAWAYVRFGSTPDVAWLLYGIKPVIIAVVLQALWNLGRAAMTGAIPIVLAAAVVVLYFVGLSPLILLFGAAVLLLAVRLAWKPKTPAVGLIPFLSSVRPALPLTLHDSHSLLTLFLTFLKIGAVLYGSGYVLLAFLTTDFVGGLHWLTERQLIDAVAVGQVTPGPVFTTATFIGYLVGGVAGSVAATVGIFLPGFAFIPFMGHMLRLVERHQAAKAFLDGASAAALGLIAAVALQLAGTTLTGLPAAIAAVVAIVVMWRWALAGPALVAGGAAAGLAGLIA